MKLNSLYINAFRGATKPITMHFSNDKNIALIYAENGNGKTTIADAFICLCTDGIGSLADKSNTDLSFLKSLGAQNKDLLIQLQTDTQLFKATLSPTSNKIVKTPNANLPKLNALRRSQITLFIEGTASDRYKTLASFIDVSNIQKSETELKKLIASLDTDFTSSTRSLTDATHTLTEIWNKEGNPLGNLNSWVQGEIQKDNSKQEKEFRENNSVLGKWELLQGTVTNINRERGQFDIASASFKAAEDNLKNYHITNPDTEANVLALLNETRNFLSSQTSVDKCPVCEKDNTKESLLSNVSARIAKMQDLNKLNQNVNSAKVEKDKLYHRLQAQIEPFNVQLIAFKNEASAILNFEFKNLLTSILDANTTKDNYKEFTTITSQISTEIVKFTTHNQSINKSILQYNSIKSNSDSIARLTVKCKELEKLLSQAKQALVLVENTRKAFIDNELSSISGDVEAMYQSIHPNEGLGNVKLFLNRKYQSSLELSANFLTESDITPQSVYSESHLDTLGICIFIALAKKESNKDLILILDDVVMSVDENHLDRIIDLIHSESKNFAQVLITTHYRPWRERYRNNRAPNSDMQFIELRGWTKERGITLAKPQMVLDEIRFFIATPENFHRENLAGATGRFLEALLDFLSFNFQCRLKRKAANDFTLSELLDCLSKDLLKILRVQKMELLPDGKYSETNFTEEVYLKPLLDNIKALKAIRNQVGAHFTFDGALVGDNDIEDFAKHTIQLSELLICPVDGNFPYRNKSGSYWETKNGSIRLFPLIEP